MATTTTYSVHVRSASGAVTTTPALTEADAWLQANTQRTLGGVVTVVKKTTTTADVVGTGNGKNK